MSELIDEGLTEVSKLEDKEDLIFSDLVSGSSSIGDGEAATIAIAAKRQFLPVTDDRKARTQAIRTLNGEKPFWSLDLLFHNSVLASLGRSTIVDSLFLALRDGRMRIPLESTQFVIELLGRERAQVCTCLPGYRNIFGRSTMLRSGSS